MRSRNNDYTYDAGGNILKKTEYPLTTGSLDGQTGTVVNYTYGNEIICDANCNFKAYDGKKFSLQGK